MIGKLFLVVTALLFATPAHAQVVGSKSWFVEVDADFGFYPKLIKSIDNVPLQIRKVTAHPDDPITPGRPVVMGTNVFFIPDPNINGRLVTIPDAHVDVQGAKFISVDLMINHHGSDSRNEFIFGPTFDIPFSQGPVKDNTGNTREYNYTTGGTSRGQGAAMVYYSAVIKPSLIPGLHVGLKHALSGGKFLVGYRFTPYQLRFTTGLDRFDELTESNSFVGAKNLMHQPYAGMELLYNKKAALKRHLIFNE